MLESLQELSDFTVQNPKCFVYSTERASRVLKAMGASGRTQFTFSLAKLSPSYPKCVPLSHCLLGVAPAYAVPWSLPKAFPGGCQLAWVRIMPGNMLTMKTDWGTCRRVLKATSRTC